MKGIRSIGVALVTLCGAALAVMCFPEPLFAHQLIHGHFTIWSDRPIDEAGARHVLDDAQRRIENSAFYSPNQRFRVFICNDNWKLALYSERFSGGMGGATDTVLTRNVYLREADLSTNRLIPAHPGRAPMADRPLSYYIAHEATQAMESRVLGRLEAFRYPHWMTEGYADHVGKGGQFDLASNLAALKAGDPTMDPKRSGLYRRYQLEVEYELQRRSLPVREMFRSRTPESVVLAQLQADPGFGR